MVVVWSLKGNGTRTTAPNSKLVVGGIFVVVPHGPQGVLGELRGGLGEPALVVSLAQEITGDMKWPVAASPGSVGAGPCGTALLK
ncbi:MAG: hypothetical protein HY900_36460 [Deltaproteobacteria bacterium]|nr:hypothetical protein [Deltaproteobacteria bacterium]